MSTTPTPNPANNESGECPPGASHAYGLNLKMLVEETIKDLAETRDKFEALAVQGFQNMQQLALKTLADAQAAANLLLVNATSSADLINKQAIRHADIIAADEEEEQQVDADMTDDDINKISQAVTAAVTAVLANMATGRPPVNTSGAATTAAPASH